MSKGLISCAFLSMAIAMLFTSCKRNIIEGHGEQGTETRDIAAFHAIKIEAPLTATITTGAASPSLQLSGYKNLLQVLKTDVQDGVLHIYLDELADISTDEDIKAEISVPALTGLNIEGASDASIKGPLQGDHFELSISGSAGVLIDDINTNKFTATITGSGDLDVSKGRVNDLSYTVTGAGDINSFPLLAHNASVKVTGAGDVEIYAIDKLTATITGAGDIAYKGHPLLTTKATGAGIIEDAN